MQQAEKDQTGTNQHPGVESEDADGFAEIALLRAEENIRLAAAPVIVLLHLRIRDQVGDFLVDVELFRRDRAVGRSKSGAIEGHFSAEDAVDDGQILVQFAPIVGFDPGKDGERFLQIIEPLGVARIRLVPRDDGIDLALCFVLPFREGI